MEGMSSESKKYWMIITVLSLALAAALLVLNGKLSAPGLQLRTPHPVDEVPEMEEIWAYGHGRIKAVWIQLHGPIMREENRSIFAPPLDRVDSVLAQIRAATADAETRMIIFDINSPGGAVTPTDEIYNALEQFKASGDRTVFVFVRDLAASGGYYAAMAGDRIYAEPTSIVGSVGVIMQSLNVQGLSGKIGITSVTIASGENKDLLNPFEAVDPEHVRILRKVVDDAYARFAAIVMRSRNLESRDLLDGRVFSAADAEKLGLIDGTAYWPEVLYVAAEELAGGAELKVIRYETPTGFAAFFAHALAPLDLRQYTRPHSPKLLYLWNF